jgi:hypothetical protein
LPKRGLILEIKVDGCELELKHLIIALVVIVIAFESECPISAELLAPPPQQIAPLVSNLSSSEPGKDESLVQ